MEQACISEIRDAVTSYELASLLLTVFLVFDVDSPWFADQTFVQTENYTLSRLYNALP